MLKKQLSEEVKKSNGAVCYRMIYGLFMAVFFALLGFTGMNSSIQQADKHGISSYDLFSRFSNNNEFDDVHPYKIIADYYDATIFILGALFMIAFVIFLVIDNRRKTKILKLIEQLPNEV